MMSSSKCCRRHFRVIAEIDSIVDVMSVGPAVGIWGTASRLQERRSEVTDTRLCYDTNDPHPNVCEAYVDDPLQG